MIDSDLVDRGTLKNERPRRASQHPGPRPELEVLMNETIHGTDDTANDVNPQACGLGQGEQCCAYLVMGGDGFICGRTDVGISQVIRARIAKGAQKALRTPVAPIPECQIFGGAS